MQTFIEINQQREAESVSKRALCARANINPSTFTRIQSGSISPTVRTLRKLQKALEELIAEQEAAV